MEIPILNNKKCRQYSISSPVDSEEIINGRCPSYALNWSSIDNEKYWPLGHDYFIGNGKSNTSVEEEKVRQILSEKLARGTLRFPIIFCDLDGVLADFEKGIEKALHKKCDQLDKNMMFKYINKSKDFYEKLDWMPRGRELWEKIKEYDPIILTGVLRNKSTIEQKMKWCKRELGEDIHVITCYTKDKPKYCLLNSILIDDRPINKDEWREKGGKFMIYSEDSLDDIVNKIKKYADMNGFQSP